MASFRRSRFQRRPYSPYDHRASGLDTRLHEAQVQAEVIQEILQANDGTEGYKDSYIVIKSNATTVKAMRKVEAGELSKPWRKSSR